MRVLTVNAGSSSLKLRWLDANDALLADETLDWPAGADLPDLEPVVHLVHDIDAVGHRVVHGGMEFQRPTRIDDDVEQRIAALSALAPLHQPRALAGIRAIRAAMPTVPTVACFDTAFHATLSPAAATYALPADWRDRWPIRRFGFHGLSHAYAARRAGALTGGHEQPLRVVSCHLGAGASLCASSGGRSVDTTMGFTPLDGLVMATRAGSIDPGLVLWLITDAGLPAPEVARALESASGLAGLAGGSGDMRDILTRRRAGDAAAELAFEVYVHRLAREVAAMAASLGGLDALVFTGGVGEHAPEVRAVVADRLGFLGVAIDPSRNVDAAGPECDISADVARAATLVIQAREDLEIGRMTRTVLAAPAVA